MSRRLWSNIDKTQMKIFVKAKPGSKEEKIELVDERNLIVSVREPPVGGRANEAIIRALASHFGVSNQCVRIVSGHFTRNKIIEILAFI